MATIPAGTAAGATVAVNVLNWNGNGFLTQSWGSTVAGANCGGNINGQFFPAPRAKAICPADFNGDGKADLAAVWTSGTSTTLVQPVLSQGAMPDLLTSVKNSLGGTTSVAYTPSSAWVNGYLPFIMQTATSVTLNDGRGNQSTTSYAYAGGSWQAGVRRFISFRTVTAMLPCNTGETACPSRRTTFTQTAATAYPRPELIEEFDGAGNPLRTVDEEYTINNTVLPWSTLNTATWTYVYEGGASKRTKVTRTFDVYGNARLITQYGNFDVAGDEVLSSIVFAPNTTSYLVNYMGAVTIRAGADISAPIIAQTLYNYDGATDWNAPPVKGDLTRQQNLISTTTDVYANTSSEYDVYGNVTATIDPVGNRSTFIYDPTYHLFVTEARDPLYAAGDTRHKTTTTWDHVCGLPLQMTDVNNLNTVNQYDVLCRPTRTDTPGGGFAITSYVNVGTPTAQYVQTQTPPADGSGNLWSRSFLDGFGRTYQSAAKGLAAAQIEVDTAFTQRGAIASVTAPFYVGDATQTTSYRYDALDRKIEKQYPDANKVQGSYGLSSIAGGFQKTVITDELLRPRTVHTDAYGRTIQEERSLAGQPVLTDYQYDLLGRLVGLTDDAGNQWTYTYDSLGRRLTAADPDLGSWSYEYDAAGRLTLQTDALGQKTRLTYDGLGRLLTKTTRADTLQAQTTTWTYDEVRPGFYNVGELTTVSNAAAIITYNFDAEGRQVGQTYTVDGIDYSFAGGFDPGGRLLWQSYPDGDSVGSATAPITYDAAGRLKAVPGFVTDTTYDALGQPLLVSRANGVWTDYDYSAARNWLTYIYTENSSGTIVQDLDYHRDALGRIYEVWGLKLGEDWYYSYDDLDRLVLANNDDDDTLDQSFQYDTVGNMTFNSAVGVYSYPAPGWPQPHAVTNAAGTTYGYDANGNMIAAGNDVLTYDGENRLASVTAGATTVQFVYGPDGARLKKIVDGATTLYLGDDVEVIPGSSAATGQYTKYLMPGDVWRSGSGSGATTYWVHRNYQGSIDVMTRPVGTALAVTRTYYTPYGHRLTSVIQSKGYIGERHDEETRLIYLHARYYDPVLARFIQADPSDPIGARIGTNRYAYAGNNPVLYLDPSGLISEKEVAAIHGDHGVAIEHDEDGGEHFSFGRYFNEDDLEDLRARDPDLVDRIQWSSEFGALSRKWADERRRQAIEDNAASGYGLINDILGLNRAQKATEATKALEEGDLQGAMSVLSGSVPPGPTGRIGRPRGTVTGQALAEARKEFQARKPAAWREEAARNPQKYTPEQLAKMRDGKAPVGSDGYSMEIHHKKQLKDGGTNDFDNFEFMTREQHRLGSNYKQNHPGL